MEKAKAAKVLSAGIVPNPSWTKSRSALIVIVATIITIGSFASAAERPEEPLIQGRHLSEWLTDLNAKGAVRHRAEEAIQSMGTNGLPYLLERLATKESDFKTESGKPGDS